MSVPMSDTVSALPSSLDRLRRLVEHPRTQGVIAAIILLNAVTLGLETSASAMAAAGDPILARMLAEERVEAEQVDSGLLLRLAGYLRPHRTLATLALVLAWGLWRGRDVAVRGG